MIIEKINDKFEKHYIPGARIIEFDSLAELEDNIKLGFGLEIEEHYSKTLNKIIVVVSHSGVLKFSKPNRIWIESMSKIYIPYEGDRIIGKVVKKSGDYYQIDFGGPCFANLNFLNFQDATKNNRPNVKIGDVIYCQISLAGRGIEPEVTCVNNVGKSVGMGVVDHCENSICKVDLPTARKLLNIEAFPMLKKIGAGILPHEIIIGSNGWIWIAARSSREFVTLLNCIDLIKHMKQDHIKDLIRTVRQGMFYSES